MIKMDKKRAGVMVFCLAAAIGFSGCDMVKSIKEYFSKSDKKSTTQSNQPPAATNQKNKPTAFDVLARVGNWSITGENFKNRLEALKEVVPEYDITDRQARQLVLDELVRQQLFVEEAERTGLAKDKDIVAAVEEFRRTLIVREMAKRITENITATEQDAIDFYEENREVLVDEAEWKVREIVIDTKAKATELLAEILNGADFGEIARMHSKGDDASLGGDMGFIKDVPFAEMAEPLLALNEGEISDVFEGPQGYYLIKFEEKRGGNQIPFEDIRDDLMANRKLFKQQQKVLDYINELKQRIEVEINENNL